MLLAAGERLMWVPKRSWLPIARFSGLADFCGAVKLFVKVAGIRADAF
jgi:hypothetical protein